MVRFRLLMTLAAVAIASAVAIQGSPQLGQPEIPRDHVTWVAQALKRMQTIKPGMTREDLLRVFTTEGGLSTGLQRTFVSRDCPYFKVDVEFKAVGRPDRDRDGRVTLIEADQDIIVKISQPYLQFSILD
ncbi:MAG TPA: hypothetical protein VKU01_16490 [Bryobacteraceae bacterium]|nr:hypothetical protein [Bryobacteraceae bacterium]